MNILRYFRLRRQIRAKQLQLASINGANQLCIELLQHNRNRKEEYHNGNCTSNSR